MQDDDLYVSVIRHWLPVVINLARCHAAPVCHVAIHILLCARSPAILKSHIFAMSGHRAGILQMKRRVASGIRVA